MIIRGGGSDFFRTFAMWIKKNPIEPAKSVKIIAGFFYFYTPRKHISGLISYKCKYVSESLFGTTELAFEG